ncbi:DUF4139 domain-containing protein [Campylobacter geochelonis]|uniref:DUF4139 domain-containing protein n=1 Tax=Campylobacter geochelonis TaxID=1780362 RepID=UPI0007707D66|nr:DUF4139 domain-containing protein [Campylobacter geochelonis]CZE50575.1 Uncharacterised protein [Campylobacter geochelonis]
MKFFILLFFAVFAFGKSGIDFYTNVAILEKSVITKDAKAVFSVPFDIKEQDILVDSNCSITSTGFDNYKQIQSPLEAQKESLNNRLLALQDSYNIIKNSKLNQNQPREFDKISGILDKNLNEQNQISKELGTLNFVTTSPAYKKDFVVKTACKKATVGIRYSLSTTIKPLLKNTIRANLEKNSVEILQEVILSNLDEDLKNATVRFFPYATNQNQKPGNFSPIYLHKEEPKKVLDAPSTMVQTPAVVENIQPKQTLVPATNNNDQPLHNFKFWQIDGLDLKAKNDNKITINKQILDANFSSYIDGYGTSKAYIMARVLPKFDIQAANTNYYLNSRFVLNAYAAKGVKNTAVDIFFGADNLIEVRKNISDIVINDTPAIGSETAKNIWEYGVKNGSNKTENIIFVERIPISNSDEIVVKKLGDIEQNADSQGKVEYKFALEPKQEKVFKFGYTVSKPIK